MKSDYNTKAPLLFKSFPFFQPVRTGFFLSMPPFCSKIIMCKNLVFHRLCVYTVGRDRKMNKNTSLRQGSLRAYLDEELRDVLTLRTDALLYKSTSRKRGSGCLLLSVLGLFLAAFLLYQGLTYQEYVYGWGAYILTPSQARWSLIWMGVMIVLACLYGILHWINLQRSLLKIYVNEIKGNAISFPGSFVSEPVILPIRKIRSARRIFLHVVVIRTESKTYFFNVRKAGKAIKMLKLQLNILKSSPQNQAGNA